MENKQQNIQSIKNDRSGKFLARNVLLFICLFFTSAFSVGFIGLAALWAVVPLGVLLFLAIKKETQYFAPGHSESKFY